MSVLSISKNSLYNQVGKFLKTALKSFQDANLWTNRCYEIGGPSFSLFNRWNIQMRLLIWQQILKTSCHWLLSAIQLAWKVNRGECWPDYNSPVDTTWTKWIPSWKRATLLETMKNDPFCFVWITGKQHLFFASGKQCWKWNKGLCNNYQEGGGGPKMSFTKGKIR